MARAFLPYATVGLVLGSFLLVWPSGAGLHAQTTQQDWEQEAVRRYPDLGIRGTPLNNEFVAEYRRMRNSPDDAGFFSNPSWPVVLAAQCENRLETGTADSESNPTPRAKKHKQPDPDDQAEQRDIATTTTDNVKQKSDHSADTAQHILIGAGVICFLYIFAGLRSACPSCHRWWSRKVIGSQIIGKENITKMVTLYDRSYRAGHANDSQSHIITEKKRPVSVERTHYNISCQCKHCNHQWREVAHSDSA
jgi:hypothetical protein